MGEKHEYDDSNKSNYHYSDKSQSFTFKDGTELKIFLDDYRAITERLEEDKSYPEEYIRFRKNLVLRLYYSLLLAQHPKEFESVDKDYYLKVKDIIKEEQNTEHISERWAELPMDLPDKIVEAIGEQALLDAALKPRKEKKVNKTRAKAAEKYNLANIKTDNAPLVAITDKHYQNAIGFNPKGKAYLQPICAIESLDIEKDEVEGRYYLLVNGALATEIEIQGELANCNITKINLNLLRVLYSIVLEEFEKSDHKILNDKINIYLPDLLKRLNMNTNINEPLKIDFISKIQIFSNIVGILEEKDYNGLDKVNYYAVMNFVRLTSDNVLTFESPYINRIIEILYKVSITKAENRYSPKQLEAIKRKGMPIQPAPTYSYLIKSSLAKERSLIAQEIVVRVVQLIEQAGNNEPTIAAQTILNDIPAYKEFSAKENDQNIKRLFKNAWKYLKKNTRLIEYYKDIKLPNENDESCLPTKSTLDMVFKFPHKGKIKPSKKESED